MYFRLKKLTVIIFLLGIAAFLAESCSDSLGIEQNIKKILIDTTSSNKPPHPEPILPDSYEFKMTELTILPNSRDTATFTWLNAENLFYAKIDTSGTTPFLWLNSDFTNINRDSSEGTELEHVIQLKMKFDSLKCSGTYKLKGEHDNQSWSEIWIYNIGQQDIYNLTGPYSPVSIEFENHITVIEKTIKIKISADVQSKYFPLRKLLLSGYLLIRYH